MPPIAAPTTLLGEIAATRDAQRSGAVDLTWDGVSASIYFVFGQPSHATFARGDGTTLEGSAALDRLVDEVPDDVSVGPWRRVMIPEDTLRGSIDDLLQRCSKSGTAAGGLKAPTAGVVAAIPALVPFRVDDFPLLPLGTSLWSDAAANVVHLDMLAPQLPDSLIVLTATGRRAAAVITNGTIRDAVWVDGTTALVGEDAARALMDTDEGSISCYGLDDERLLAAIPLLWRSPRPISGLHADWLDADRLLASLREDGRSCALLVDGSITGAALVWEGDLVATYTEHRRRPSGTPAALRSLLRTAGARVTLVSDAESRPFDRRLGEEAFHLFIGHETAAMASMRDLGDEAAATPGAGVSDEAGAAPEEEPVLATAVEVTDLDLVEVDAAVAVGADSDADGVDRVIDTLDGDDVDAQAPADTGDEDVDAAARATDTSTPDATRAGSPPDGGEDLFEVGSDDFVPPRLSFDVAALRNELIEIATVWLGAADVEPIAELIRHARPGVDEFVGTIAAIGALQIPTHESAVVRAMAREMHFRAAEVLCGV